MSYGDGFGYGNSFTGGAGFGGYGSVMEPGASVWLCKFYINYETYTYSYF